MVYCREGDAEGPYISVEFLTSTNRSTGGTTLMQYVMHHMGVARVKLVDCTNDPEWGSARGFPASNARSNFYERLGFQRTDRDSCAMEWRRRRKRSRSEDSDDSADALRRPGHVVLPEETSDTSWLYDS